MGNTKHFKSNKSVKEMITMQETNNQMNEKQIKNLLQTFADIIGEQRGLKISVEIQKK